MTDEWKDIQNYYVGYQNDLSKELEEAIVADHQFGNGYRNISKITLVLQWEHL